MKKKQVKENCYLKSILSVFRPETILILGLLIAGAFLFLDYGSISEYLGYPSTLAIITISLLIFAYVFRFSSFLFSHSITKLDLWLASLLIGVILYYSLMLVVQYLQPTPEKLSVSWEKVISATVVTLVLSVLLLVRKNRIESVNNRGSKTSVFSLKELYEGKIKPSLTLDKVFIEDSPIDGDIFGREKTIELLRGSIENSRPSNSFKIGLTGPWGSGKTTILNNALKSLDEKYILVSFDPTKFSGKEKVIFEYYQKIWNKLMSRPVNNTSNGKLSGDVDDVDFSRFAASLARNVTGKPIISIDDFIPGDEAKQAIRMINAKLETDGTYLVVVIDNIERCQADEILALLSILSSSEIRHAIYILSFEKEILEKHLSEELHMSGVYLEKVINMEIQVPENKKMFIVLSVCIENLSRLNGNVRISNIVTNGIAALLYPLISTPRELIRFLNSAVIPSLADKRHLNIQHLILVRFIREKNNELYRYLGDNGQYLAVTSARAKNIQRADFKKYFSRFTEEYSPFLEILCELFPSIRKYYKMSESRRKNYNGTFEYFIADIDSSIDNNSISNPAYFDMYFDPDIENIRGQDIVKRVKKVIN